MSAMVGPDGKPPTFDGAAWISQDGRYFWNGAAWQPIKKRGFRLPIALPLIIVAVLVGAWYVLQHLPQPSPIKYGVTNARIDSSTEFDFDYARPKTCNDLTFDYPFFDKSGQLVDTFTDEKHSQVDGGRTVHFDVFIFVAINSHAVRFDAIPTCHDKP
jgi:hypothetical protein